jgi:hypothetical protein
LAPKKKLTEEEIRKIIHEYKTTKKAMGLLEPAKIARYNQELYELGEVSAIMEASFWRKQGRLGRDLIDEANKVFSHKLTTSEGNEVEVPNVSDLVIKYGHDKERLISELTLLEMQLISSNKRENELKQQVVSLNDNLVNYKNELSQLKDQVNDLQELIFKMVRYSAIDDVPLFNQLDIQNQEVGIFKEALEGMFDKPIQFYLWFDGKMVGEKQRNDSNVVLINKTETKKSLAKSIKNRYLKE